MQINTLLEHYLGQFSNQSISRRQAIRKGLGVVAAMAGAGLVLDACTGNSSTTQVTPTHSSGPPSVVMQWNNAALQMIKNGHLGPPIVARVLAVVHTCMYDAWAAYDEGVVGTRLGNTLRRPTSEHTQANKEKAISYAPKNTPTTIADPNAWQPLRVSTARGIYVTQQYVTAFCGMITPFALGSASQFRPSRPAVYPSQEYTQQAQQILDCSANLTNEQKVIVEYWADGPGTVQPPGHWNLFAQFVSQRDNLDLDAQVKLFFILTNAVFDAGIAAWETKRFYNSERPITAIHFHGLRSATPLARAI